MNPGMGLDTALVETGAALFKILFGLVVAAIFAGILTLPLFYGILAIKVAWFWACDVTSGRLARRSPGRRPQVRAAAFSLFATVLSLGYFGAFDYPNRLVTGLPSNKLGPTQAFFKDRFDRAVRKYAEVRHPALPQDVPILWARCPAAAPSWSPSTPASWPRRRPRTSSPGSRPPTARAARRRAGPARRRRRRP